MKAIMLMSGGLDSTLAARLMRDLGIELIGLNTISPFCLCHHRSAQGNSCGIDAIAKELSLRLVRINVAKEFLEIVRKPKHGYGSNMNPCIDCRILLFQKAKELMQKEGACFVITGEVLGQRPMSQRLHTLKLIEQEAGLEGLVLRPLSAKVLQQTIPEKNNWVCREKLLAIAGRGRRQQITLAAEWGIKDYPCPAGGCLLTDPEFSRRLKDLLLYREFSLGNIQLLKVGRHFRLNTAEKLVVGRNETENLQLANLAQNDDYLFFPDEHTAGPTCLGRAANFNQDSIQLACRIAGRYCDLNGGRIAAINYRKFPEEKTAMLEVSPLEEEQLISLRI